MNMSTSRRSFLSFVSLGGIATGLSAGESADVAEKPRKILVITLPRWVCEPDNPRAPSPMKYVSSLNDIVKEWGQRGILERCCVLIMPGNDTGFYWLSNDGSDAPVSDDLKSAVKGALQEIGQKELWA